MDISNFNSLYVNIRSVSYYWGVASEEGTKWMTRGYRAYCSWQGAEQTADPKNCPVEPVPLVKIKSNSTYQPILTYANGVPLSNYWGNSDRVEITLYQAWDACSDTGLCTIELMATINQALVDVGSIVVDMDNKMKIVHVHAITGFELFHDEKLNSIEIKMAS